MVYIANDGRVLDSTPFTVKRIFGFFSSIMFMVIMFFRTLVNPDSTGQGNSSTRDFRPGSGPRPPSRRIGRINTDAPPVPFGGCRSCAG